MMKISVSSYSFEQKICDGKMEMIDCLEKAKEIGLDTVDFTDLHIGDNRNHEDMAEYAKQIRAKADELGMNIHAYYASAHLYHETDEDNARVVEETCRKLDLAAILGCKVFRHDVTYHLRGKGRSFDLQLPTLAENCRRISDYAMGLGIKTCVENHGYIAQDSDRMERLFNAVNHENFGLLVDFGNFCCADEDNARAVSKVAPYAVMVHAKDMHYYKGDETNPGNCWNTRGGAWFRGAIIGQGDVPVKQCLRAMKFAGYDGYVCIEFEGKEDCILGITEGFATLKKYIEEVEQEA